MILDIIEEWYLLHFSKNEKKEIEEQEQFKKLFEENKKYLKVLGDFTANYIIV